MASASQIDDTGNDALSWLRTADDLLASRDTLAKQRTNAEDAADGLPLPRRLAKEEHSYWIEVMMVGFAVENLLKALWVARGNLMYSKQRLQKIPGGKKNHDLVSIAAGVGFPITSGERNDLSKLSEIMIGIGRYPLAPRPSDRGVAASWADTADATIQGLTRRLREAVRVEMGN